MAYTTSWHLFGFVCRREADYGPRSAQQPVDWERPPVACKAPAGGTGDRAPTAAQKEEGTMNSEQWKAMVENLAHLSGTSQAVCEGVLADQRPATSGDDHARLVEGFARHAGVSAAIAGEVLADLAPRAEPASGPGPLSAEPKGIKHG